MKKELEEKGERFEKFIDNLLEPKEEKLDIKDEVEQVSSAIKNNEEAQSSDVQDES